MKAKLARWFRSQRSQGLTEFALIAPVILLLTFGIIDFGRAIYFWVTIQQASREAVRTAAAYSLPLPDDASVTAVARSQSPGLTVNAFL